MLNRCYNLLNKLIYGNIFSLSGGIRLFANLIHRRICDQTSIVSFVTADIIENYVTESFIIYSWFYFT